VSECAEDDCTESAAVRLHVPWAENREVCAAHARVLAKQDGVVAEPIDEGGESWP